MKIETMLSVRKDFIFKFRYG